LVAEEFWLWERMFRVRLWGHFPDHLHFPCRLNHFWDGLVSTFLINKNKKAAVKMTAAFSHY